MTRGDKATSLHRRPGIFACLAAILLGGAASSAQKANPAAILALAADYIAAYERQVVVVVAQEDYRQRVASATLPTRDLRSELVIIADPERGWLEFRDVFEVDGRRVRDHDDRIAQLFLKPNPNARQRAARIVEESARFNLDPAGTPLDRTLNIPLEALQFLRAANQSRSRFELAGEQRTDDGVVVVVRFEERAQPRLISSPLAAPASGRFWIRQGSGAVVRSELKMSAPSVNAAITVRYARQFEPPLWLPVSMDEEYDLTNPSVAISGRATYSNFRRFQVDVSTNIR